jgi:ATP-dependent helicase/nuclease subunit A
VRIAGDEFVALYETGDREWYCQEPVAREAVPRPPEAQAVAPDFARQPSRRRPLQRLEPSAQAEEIRDAAWLFSLETRDVLDFGSAIHELFARVTWAGECDAETLIAEWRKTAAVSEAVQRDVGDQFRRALASGEVAQALAKPAGPVELWREKRFEIVIDDEWISGAFDRVTIMRDPSGKATRAEIMDFKSDRIGSDAEMARAAGKYTGQIALYGRVLCRILGLAPADVALSLLFTRPARIWPVAVAAEDAIRKKR